MKKLWLVFRHEYTRHVLRKRFILALVSVPFFIIVMGGLGILAAFIQNDQSPIGYVDHSGVLVDANQRSGAGGWMAGAPIVAYKSEANARQAMAGDEIQAFFIVTADYLQSGEVVMEAVTQPGNNVESDFRNFLRYNLAQRHPSPVAERLYSQPLIEMRTLDAGREMAADQAWNFVIPLAAGVLFMIAVNISGGYLVQALVEEKENRTMEIVVTSVSPMQLMMGKILGDILVGLTQLTLWIGFPLLALLVLSMVMPPIAGLTLDAEFVGLVLAMLLPAFILVAGLMAIVGAVASDSREAQQIAGLFTMPLFIPYWFIGAILANPNSSLAIGLSLFPLTAPVTLPLRAAYTVIPPWQIVTSLVLLIVSAIGALWLAAWVFRLGMLRYGKRLRLKELFTQRTRGEVKQ